MGNSAYSEDTVTSIILPSMQLLWCLWPAALPQSNWVDAADHSYSSQDLVDAETNNKNY